MWSKTAQTSLTYGLLPTTKNNNTLLTGLNADTISFSKKSDSLTEREVYAQHMLSEFNKLIETDKAQENPLVQKVNPSFITKFNNHIINNPNKPFLIAIAGESASGKTTICDTIKQSLDALNVPIEIMSADNYFKDISELIKKHGSFDKLLASGYDVDSPNNFNMEQLYTDLSELSEGKDVRIPQYLINGTGVVVPNAIPKKSQNVIIVEGMATMYGKVSDLFDLKLFIDIKPEIQEKWYIDRAKTSRNQNEENARKQLAYVREVSKKYILPKKNNSDIILNGGCSLDYLDEVIRNIYNITTSNKTSA